MRSHRPICIAATLGTLFAINIAATTRAATVEWINNAGGVFSTAANWSPGVVPGSSDTALFDLSSPYVVTFSTSPILSALTQNDGFVTMNLVTRSLSTTSTAASSMGNVAGLTSTLDILNGTFRPANFSIGAVERFN